MYDAKSSSVTCDQSYRLPIVVRDNAAQSIPPANDTLRSIFWLGNWKILVDSRTRPCLVAATHEFAQHTIKLLLVEQENLVQTFLPSCTTGIKNAAKRRAAAQLDEILEAWRTRPLGEIVYL